MFRESPEGVNFVQKHARSEDAEAPTGTPRRPPAPEPLVMRVEFFEYMGATEAFVSSIPISIPPNRPNND